MFKKIIYPLLIILASIIAIIPLFQSGYFSNHEEFFPMFRLYELYRGLQAGYFFPRWGLDWVFGFGYPFFNFYSPLSYYFAAFWHWLGFGLTDSIKIVFGASIVLSGLTMYLWAKEFWGREGGLISAVVYMYLPYRLTDIYTRGNLAESFAFVWLPLILYATHKILQLNKNPSLRITRYSLLLSFSLAALILTHNLTAVYFLPIMVAYAIHIFIVRASEHSERVENLSSFSMQPAKGGLWSKDNMKPLLLATCYLLLGLSLSAFFWFPALYDTRFVRTQDMIQMWYLPIQFLWSNIGHTEHFDFLKQQFYPIHGILIGSGTILAIVKYIIDKRLNNDPPKADQATTNNGRRPNNQLSIILFSLLFITILVFFITPLSQPVWEILPKQFHYIQFSWRLLIFVGLFVSFLCGSILQLNNDPPKADQITMNNGRRPNNKFSIFDPPTGGQFSMILIVIALIIISTFPRLQTVYALNALSDNDITVEKSWNWDRQFGTLGNTAQSEYLPKWTDKEVFRKLFFTCHSERSEESRSPAGGETNEILRRSAPQDNTGCGIMDFTQTQKVNLEKEELVTFNTFYFPGWQASIDRFKVQSSKFKVQEKTGFIQITVPAGEHEVKIWFGSAPWRRWSEAVSIISLISLIGLICLRRKSFQI